MVSYRVKNLREAYNEIQQRRFLSIHDISVLMDCVEKVLMEVDRLTLSRENWKKRYREALNGGGK